MTRWSTGVTTLRRNGSGRLTISSIVRTSRRAERVCSTWSRANRITVDIVRLQNGLIAEHWDVVQDEATAEESKSGLPMFGDSFPTRA